MSESSFSGLEIIGDLKFCDQFKLSSVKSGEFKEYLLSLISKYQLTSVGFVGHDFDKGFTAIVALAESHIAIHTWPDQRYVSVDIHVCNYSRDNSQNAERLFNELCTYFSAERIEKHTTNRSMA